MPVNSDQRFLFRVPSTPTRLSDQERLDRLNNDINLVLQVISSTFRNLLGLEGTPPPFAANLDMGTHRITNMGAPIEKADATTKKYVDNLLDELRKIIEEIRLIIHAELPTSRRDILLSRLLPTGANSIIGVGYFQVPGSGHSLDVAVTISDGNSTSLAKRYLIGGNRSVNAAWETAFPFVDTGVSANSDDFDLEVNQVDGDDRLHLRLRRTAGTSTAATALVHIQPRGLATEIFTETSTTATGVTVATGFFESTLLTQRDGFVGFRNQIPSFPLHGSVETTGAANIALDGYGGDPRIVGRRAEGNRTAATATAAGSALLLLGGHGSTGVASFTARRGAIILAAEETFTDVAQGTLFAFRNTSPGTITETEGMRFTANRNLMIGTTSSPASATQALVIQNGVAPASDIASQHSYLGATTSTNITSVPAWRSSDGITLRLFQQAALTATSGTAFGAAGGGTNTSDQTIISNTITRLTEIETRLRILGLLP